MNTILSVTLLVSLSLTLFQLTTVNCIQSSALSKLKDEMETRAESKILDPKEARAAVDNDFESGSASPWFDESPGYVNWRVEDHSKPMEVNSSAPRPATGTKYLRATRNADLLSGLAVLKSPVFTASPGDRVSFDFWIRSKRPEGNNLELVWLVDRKEQILAGLSQFSTVANYEWRSYTVVIPVDVPTDGELVFYGYCGSNLEDAIAIDNIVVGAAPTTAATTTTTSAPGTNCIELTETSGTFTSPNYPSNYPNDASICWLITGAEYISLSFNTFTTESGRDTVKIYRGRTVSSPLYATYSGTYAPSISLYTDSLLILFTSDSVNTYKGFSAFYDYQMSSTTENYWETTTESVSSPSCSSCSSYYGGYSGVIQSPNYPNPYCNYLECRYSITVPSGYRIRLHFTSFTTESGADVVRVYDGSTTTSPLLRTASGSGLPSDTISSRNQMLVVFITDGSVTYRGWSATYEIY